MSAQTWSKTGSAASPAGTGWTRQGSSGNREAVTFRVGFDVGGTFTDFALQADDGRLLTGKWDCDRLWN